MDKKEIDAIPRIEARQLLARIPAGRGYDNRVLLAVEQAMNLEWWRGYWSAKSESAEYVLCYPGVPAAWRVKPEDVRQSTNEN